ncbi:MAG: TM0996/MTH895 family glutaredoxin-like protein [Chloroflexi bacterium]|nr:TM0996/MTH895 family glutaredoxin-like protein [Chloroflexota bacterium]MBU1751431.1 TM0996/MTH895 family glutaredoxin-like protein [Chloroflexota bacterium]
MLEIKVLGTGCPKCKRVEQVARDAVAAAGVDAAVTKVTDMGAIMAYPILGTPGLVINEKVVSAGRIPEVAEVTTWIMNALASQ